MGQIRHDGYRPTGGHRVRECHISRRQLDITRHEKGVGYLRSKTPTGDGPKRQQASQTGAALYHRDANYEDPRIPTLTDHYSDGYQIV